MTIKKDRIHLNVGCNFAKTMIKVQTLLVLIQSDSKLLTTHKTKHDVPKLFEIHSVYNVNLSIFFLFTTKTLTRSFSLIFSYGGYLKNEQ